MLHKLHALSAKPKLSFGWDKGTKTNLKFRLKIVCLSMIKLCIKKCLSDFYFFILNYQNSLSSSTSTRSNIESTSTKSGFIALSFLGESGISLGDAFSALKIIGFEGGGFKVGGYKVGFYLGAIYTLGFSGTKYLFTSFLFTLPTSLA